MSEHKMASRMLIRAVKSKVQEICNCDLIVSVDIFGTLHNSAIFSHTVALQGGATYRQ